MNKISNKTLIIISIICFFLILSSITFPLYYTESWNVRGQIGDTFNIVNSIATLIACIVGIATIILYGNQILIQKKEIDSGSKRQDEIEKNLSAIAMTLDQITHNTKKNLEIKSILNILDLKKHQLTKAKLDGLSNTAIANLEKEINNNLQKLDETLKT